MKNRHKDTIFVRFRPATFIVATCILLVSGAAAHAQWRLGVSIDDPEPNPNAPGVRIVGVAPGEPAHRSGLEPNDIIYRVDGRAVYTVAQFQNMIGTSQGQVVLLIRDWRTGRILEVPISLRWIAMRPPNPPNQPPANLAQIQVDAITRFLGMHRIPTNPGPVANAEASAAQNQFGQLVPIIRYNPEFLDRLYRVHGQWASISVLAHEVGHHFHGDSGFFGLFTDSWAKEMKADFVSGYVLAKAGATEDQATRALKDSFTLIGSATHPDTPRRLASLGAGWRQGKFGPCEVSIE